jgi:hypothetical protein
MAYFGGSSSYGSDQSPSIIKQLLIAQNRLLQQQMQLHLSPQHVVAVPLTMSASYPQGYPLVSSMVLPRNSKLAKHAEFNSRSGNFTVSDPKLTPTNSL